MSHGIDIQKAAAGFREEFTECFYPPYLAGNAKDIFYNQLSEAQYRGLAAQGEHLTGEARSGNTLAVFTVHAAWEYAQRVPFESDFGRAFAHPQARAELFAECMEHVFSLHYTKQFLRDSRVHGLLLPDKGGVPAVRGNDEVFMGI